MDENLDGKIAWEETKQRLNSISAYVLFAISLNAGGACKLKLNRPDVSVEGRIDYLVLQVSGACPDALTPLKSSSHLFFEIDPDHHMFLTAKSGCSTTTTQLMASSPEVMVGGETVGLWRPFFSYFKSRGEPLMGGADHLVFLFVLMPQAVGSGTQVRKVAFGDVGALTGFTLAHALTLTAAATDLLRPPGAII